MSTQQLNEINKTKRTAAIYNAVPNLLWSALSLIPVAVFCYFHLTLSLLFLFAGLCVFPAFLTNSFLDKMPKATSTIFYKRLGVGVVQQLTQDGGIVNSTIRSRYPNYKALRSNQKSIKSLLSQTYFFEKFHLVLLLFFFMASFYACSKGLFAWAAVIFLLNLFYNVYPILLQQFIRLKLALYIRRKQTNVPAENSSISKIGQKG